MIEIDPYPNKVESNSSKGANLPTLHIEANVGNKSVASSSQPIHLRYITELVLHVV